MKTKLTYTLLIIGLALSGCLGSDKSSEGQNSDLSQVVVTTTTIPDENLNLDEVDFGFITETEEVEIGEMI